MRIRALGAKFGTLPTGQNNSITDVAGVRVGHTTRFEDIQGENGMIALRTGVTAILPHSGNMFREKVNAGVHTINGFGKANGFEQIRERGVIETPILLTNTLNVGRVVDALVEYMLEDNPEIGISTGTINSIVGECNDGFLSDLRGRHVNTADVKQAIQQALMSGDFAPVEEGCVGAGTGTACFQFKGGIGTSSRQVLEGRYTVGVLVQTNFGHRSLFRFLGAPLGQHLLETALPQLGPGSIMMVAATDAPLDSRQLTRLATRVGIGLARTGSIASDGSGDFAIAFSTANRWQHFDAPMTQTVERFNENADEIDALFIGAVEATEEAILNVLTTAVTVTGRDGNTLHAIPHDLLIHWLKHYRVLE